MPEIPESAIGGANFLKPLKLNLNIGDRLTFKITKPHLQGQQGLLSIPVTYGKDKGNRLKHAAHANTNTNLHAHTSQRLTFTLTMTHPNAQTFYSKTNNPYYFYEML